MPEEIKENNPSNVEGENNDKPTGEVDISTKLDTLTNLIEKQSKAVNSLGYKVRTIEKDRQVIPQAPIKAAEEKPEGDIPDSDIAYMKRLAKKAGLVTKEESEASRREASIVEQGKIQKEAVTSFMEKYPEYDDDEKWNKLNNMMNDQFGSVPKSKTGIIAALESIRIQLDGDSGKETMKKEIEDELRAKQQTASRLALGGTGKTATAKTSDEVEAMYNKYNGRLSREIIKEQLDEINSRMTSKS